MRSVITFAFALLWLTMPLSSSAQTNLALKATVLTSFVSSWERLDAVNDGKDPRNSSDKSNGAYGNRHTRMEGNGNRK